MLASLIGKNSSIEANSTLEFFIGSAPGYQEQCPFGPNQGEALDSQVARKSTKTLALLNIDQAKLG